MLEKVKKQSDARERVKRLFDVDFIVKEEASNYNEYRFYDKNFFLVQNTFISQFIERYSYHFIFDE